METRHAIRCLRSNPSSFLITTRHGNASRCQKPSFLLHRQCRAIRSPRYASSIPSNRRYLSTSEPNHQEEPRDGTTKEPSATAPSPAGSSQQSSSPSSRVSFRSLPPKPDPRSNTDKLGEVTDILNQLKLRPPKPTVRNTNMDSIFESKYNASPSSNIMQISQRVSSSVSRSPDPLPAPKIDMRLNPSLGRTVTVDQARGFDVTRALRTMEGMCGRNKVRVQEREQKFYVRRGQKRKNLRSSRWRKLFNTSFQKTLQRCQRMRQQGW